MNISIVILAAGHGTRMRSGLPKVLHLLAGKPLLQHVVETAQKISDDVTVIYGHGGDQVKQALHEHQVTWVEQKDRLGTGHAVMQALPQINKDNRVLVLCGDVPLICEQTLQSLIDRTPKDGFGWLTAHLDEPNGFGRIVRDDDNNPITIVEDKDATDLQKTIKEINTGICLLPAKYLNDWLPNLKNNNAQGEYYLTDVFSMAVNSGISIVTVSPNEVVEVQGVNNKSELAQLERTFQRRQAEELLMQGVTLLDPNRFDLRGELTIGTDVVIDVNVVMEGNVEIGSNVHIGPNTKLKNVRIGDFTRVDANCVIEETIIDEHCQVGPFARLRPGAELKEKAKVGNFVEVKKSTIGPGSKVNHLSYVGDATLGKNVNVGAGTITCNYDGANKHKTIIEDEAFIGTNNSLVAPLTIGKKATTGAGSTISKDVSDNELAVARSRQTVINGWKRPVKEKVEVPEG